MRESCWRKEKYTQALFILLLGMCVLSPLPLAQATAPSFQELMDPRVFPDAQRGMTVESARRGPDSLSVVTTGASFELDASGIGVFRQRIGQPREMARIRINGGVKLTEWEHSGPGFAFTRFDAPGLDMRVNGDSLFMFHAHEPVTLEISRAIDIAFSAQYKSNYLMLDEWGGFGLFGSDPGLESAVNPYETVVARYTLPADAVLWISICPPKPFDWNRSLNEHIVWHWSNEVGYPPDSDLIAWSREGNIILLQSEVMLWKDWNLAFEPRLGEAEFARVRGTIHGQNMRFIVYTSPYYFLKGTPIESQAMNSFDNFSVTGFPPGWPDGVNIDLFMHEIAKVMRDYKPDGLYFDGQYIESPAALYALARRTRTLLGEDGLLEWHSTTALGPGLCFLPQADAYVDYILRGEGRDAAYTDFNYLRYFVSCYNTSNSIGVLCNNCSPPTRELVDKLLMANARMHTIASWLSNPKTMEVVKDYRSRLMPELRETVNEGIKERQINVAKLSRLRREEQRALRGWPEWNEPLLAATGDGQIKWSASVSPRNDAPFSLRDGVLAVTAKAHTYAFLTHPLKSPVQGFEFRMKQGDDDGMSWGPSVLLRGKSGALFRVGLRSDGLLQSDLFGEQRLFGKHNPHEWIHVRVRWLATSGVVETSTDGITFETVWQFDHNGNLSGDFESVAVGKIPYNGQLLDHSEPGPNGTCLIDRVMVY